MNERTATVEKVSLEGLSLRYGSGVLALDSVDLEIESGLFGLLGPNGAGKTTLMRILTTLLKPTGGMARVFGHDVVRDASQVRSMLGYLPQDFQTYGQLKAWEVLDYYAILNGMTDRKQRRARIEEVLALVGLADNRNQRASQLSGGMYRRLGVAQALLTDAKLLIFDEPTAGLDPAQRVRFRNFLGELSRDRIVLLSTHIVADIGSVCDRLAVLNHGRIEFLGKCRQLADRAEGRVWQLCVDDAQYEQLRSEYAITSMVDTDHGLQLRLLSETKRDPGWQSVVPTLEDAYLWLINSSDAHEQAA
ncbi:MAG: ABC transporter ATP-binding protein [Planctomycetota bacterium]|jgi:ABC-type multidrug transport system ATPase subunit